MVREREPGLGSEFVRALEDNPELSRVILPPYRKTLMRRFPFQVIYEVREDWLWVLAVYHAKRDPSQLRKRMGGQ